MGLAGPHRRGKQEANHLLANGQMAANDPGLMVSQKLFTQKKYPRAFSENTVYREQRVLSFQKLQALSRDSKLFHVFHTCSKFSLFSFVFSVFYLFFICFYSFHYLSYLVFSSFFLTFFLVFILLLIFSFQL